MPTTSEQQSSKPKAAPKAQPVLARQPALRGLADLRRNGGSLIEQVAKNKQELSFSTSATVPQIRLRPSAKSLAAEIPSEDCVTFKDVKSKLTQFRALVIVGGRFLVTSGKHSVVMDRHPKCPSDVVDGYMKSWRADIRAMTNAQTRKHAKSASEVPKEMLAYLKRSTKAQRERDEARETRDNRIIDLLEKILKQGFLTEEDRKLLGRLRLREGADAACAEKRRPGEANLDRTPLD